MRAADAGRRRVAALIGLVVASGACAPARLAVPAPLATAPRLAVTGRQGDQRALELRFGEWLVRDVRRTWVRGSGLEVSGGTIGLDLDRASQRYAFEVLDRSGVTWRGDCLATYRHDGVVVPVGTLAVNETARLSCRFAGTGGGSGTAPWTLETRQRFDRLPEGLLARGEDTLRVRGLDRMTGAVPTRGLLAGWLVTAGNGPVAAVELLNDGAVWVDTPPNAGYRRALGVVAAALLLQEDLREVMQRTARG